MKTVKEIRDDGKFISAVEDFLNDNKTKKITLKMSVRQAAAVRQILFDAQRGYTYDEQSVPPRIIDVRTVIQSLDDSIGTVLDA